MTDPALQDARWRALVAGELGVPGAVPFERHWALWRETFAGRPASAPPPAAYQPTASTIEGANVTALAEAEGLRSFADLHKWSAMERDAFWERVVLHELAIPLRAQPKAIREGAAEDPRWLAGARLNIVEACFRAPRSKTAILVAREGEPGPQAVSYAQLEAHVDRVANALAAMGLARGAGVALYMPMTVDCVAAYLGVVRAGGVVVSIADSFAPPEVASRLRLGDAKLIVTTAAFHRGGKTIDLYAKAREAGAPTAIVIGGRPDRPGDMSWEAFTMLGEGARCEMPEADPQDTTNVLFSSGTTGDPKAIPWTQLTPIKAAMDGRYHQDIHEEDVVAWPTSIGWMMGPWLIYAALVNRATIALFEGAPHSPEFPAFVERAGVTVLGVVPALVRAWRTADAVGDAFARVRVFSSTGEASNAEDYLWLMSTAGYRAPVIEYCGGTEIGGGHLTGCVVQPQSPAAFSTPALGLDVVVLDEHGASVPENAMGELFIRPPSIGLSQRLLNADHHKVYHEGAPPGLRRHGDEVERLPGGYWRAHGRADDTMNLGGIKVSSLELERAMDRHPAAYQTAAVAIVPPEGGADRLVVFVVPTAQGAGDGAQSAEGLRASLQDILRKDLNPLYKIHDVVLVDALPRTASNKIMRRELRAQYRSR